MAEKKETKLYMKWWFWVIIAVMFIFTISTFFIPDDCGDCEVIENRLRVCEDDLDWWIDWFVEYEEVMEEYCELDPTNTLC